MQKTKIAHKPNIFELEGMDELFDPFMPSHDSKIPVGCACWVQNPNRSHTYRLFAQPNVPYWIHVVGNIDYFYED